MSQVWAVLAVVVAVPGFLLGWRELRGSRSGGRWRLRMPIPRREVERLRFSALPRRKQRMLYEAYCGLVEQSRVTVRSPVAPPSLRARLQNARPVDEAPLRAVLDLLDLPDAPDLSHEISDHDLDLLLRLPDPLVQSLAAIPHWSPELFAGLADLVTYVSTSEQLLDVNGVQACDLIVVAGARRGHPSRIAKAIETADKCPVLPTLLLAGGAPAWAEANDQALSEAEAMAFHLRETYVHHPYVTGEGSLVVDSSPTDFASIQHSVRHVASERAILLGRPIAVCMVVGHFAVRRAGVMALQEASVNPNRIGDYRVIGSATRATPHMALDRTATAWKSVLTIYLGEYVKLLGGRAIGDF